MFKVTTTTLFIHKVDCILYTESVWKWNVCFMFIGEQFGKFICWSMCPMNDLQEIPFNKNLKLVSFDIKNMYSNIPTKDLIELMI